MKFIISALNFPLSLDVLMLKACVSAVNRLYKNQFSLNWWRSSERFCNRFSKKLLREKSFSAMASNNAADQQAQNSVYQKLDPVETRRQLKLSFPPSSEKKVLPPKPLQPQQQQLPTIPRWIIAKLSYQTKQNSYVNSYLVLVANDLKLTSRENCNSAARRYTISLRKIYVISVRLDVELSAV